MAGDVQSWSCNGFHGDALSCNKGREHCKMSQKPLALLLTTQSQSLLVPKDMYDSSIINIQGSGMRHMRAVRPISGVHVANTRKWSTFEETMWTAHECNATAKNTRGKGIKQKGVKDRRFSGSCWQKNNTYPQSLSLCEPAMLSDAKVVGGGGTEVTCCQVGTKICCARLDQACKKKA